MAIFGRGRLYNYVYTPTTVDSLFIGVMARLSRPKCDDAVLLGSLTFVSTRIIPLFFFGSAVVYRDQGHKFVRNMLAEYTSSIFILLEGWDCNTGAGGARHIAPEHDFVDASDFCKLTSGALLEKEEALAATAVGHLNRESIRGIVEPRF